MAALDSVICTHCRASFRASGKSTFLGFRKYVCTSCENKVIYPLGPVTRTIYWVVAALFCVVSIVALAQGNVPMPGLLFIGAGIGLFRDFSIRKQVRELQAMPTARTRKAA